MRSWRSKVKFARSEEIEDLKIAIQSTQALLMQGPFKDDPLLTVYLNKYKTRLSELKKGESTMTNTKYELRALEFDSPKKYGDLEQQITALQIRQLHAIIGLSGEAGEVSELVKKHVYYGKQLSKSEIISEVGDCLWYINILLNSIGASFSEAMEANVKKLSKRYPNGYSDEAALSRADVEDK